MSVRIIVAIVAIVAAAVIGVAVWWWQSGQSLAPPPPVAPVVDTPSAPVEDTGVPSTPEVQGVVLPPLDASDDYVREEVGALSPQMSEWLKQDDLIRRFAVLIDNAQRGDYPRRQVAFLNPTTKFPVLQADDRMVVDPEGYHRFDAVVDVAVSIEPQRAATLLRTLAPLLVDALGELGVQGPDPAATMRAGIDRALATPEVDGDVALVQPKVYYEYADPRLEALDPLQKQLLRMGPANTARIKAYLAQLKPLL
ncbi:MAG TPA: DUF3014 domain-containing protein [Pseudomonadales bacterium]